MTTPAPLSVIIPCYCCAATLHRAVRSVAQQTLLPQELILVEDGSPDGGATRQALREIQAKFSHLFAVRLILLEQNQGAANARNAGWDAASQPYIAFLDADDAWHPKKIEIQYEWMTLHPEAQITAHGRLIVEQTGNERITETKDRTDAAVVSGWKLLLSNRFSTPTVMLKKSLPYRFPEGRRYVEDYLLWLQIRLDGTPIYYIDQPLAFLYKGPYGSGGLSADLWSMEYAELAAYFELAISKRLNPLWVIPLCLWSLAKFGRRLLSRFLYRA